MFDTRLYLCPGAIYAEVMSQVLNSNQNKMIPCMYNVLVLCTPIPLQIGNTFKVLISALSLGNT